MRETTQTKQENTGVRRPRSNTFRQQSGQAPTVQGNTALNAQQTLGNQSVKSRIAQWEKMTGKNKQPDSSPKQETEKTQETEKAKETEKTEETSKSKSSDASSKPAPPPSTGSTSEEAPKKEDEKSEEAPKTEDKKTEESPKKEEKSEESPKKEEEKSEAPKSASEDSRFPDPMPPSEKTVMKSIKGAHLRDFRTLKIRDVVRYVVNEKAMIGSKIKYKRDFEVFRTITDHSGAWLLAKHGGQYGFIRRDKVPGGLGTARSELGNFIKEKSSGTNKETIGDLLGRPEDDSDKFEEVTETTDEVLEGLLIGPEGAGEYLEDGIEGLDEELEDFKGSDSEKNALEAQKGKMETANAIVGLVGAPVEAVKSGLGGIVACKKIYDAIKDREKSKAEKGFDIAEGTMDIAQVAPDQVGVVSKIGSSISTLAGGSGVAEVFDTIGEWSGSVSEAINVIKSTFFIVKEVYETFEKAFSNEGISGGEIAEATLSIITHGLEAAKSGIEALKPILELLNVGGTALNAAIPGIGIAISGIKITMQVYQMIKSTVHAYKMTSIKRKFKKEYKEKGRKYVKKKEYKLFGRTVFRSIRDGTDKELLEKRKADIESSTDEEEQQELRDIREYELAKEMKNINIKRLKRAGFKVGMEMMNIAGDIATLTGYGASVGMPLKAVAAGASVGMSIGRKFKQWGRDLAAHQKAPGWAKYIFDTNKTTAAKNARRERDANLILQMIAELPEYVPGDDAIKEQYRRVENFIASTGVGLKAFYRLNGQPDKQRKLLMDAMKKRE